MSKRIFKISVLAIVVVSIIAIGVASVSAQGPGNNGRGRNGAGGQSGQSGQTGQYGYGGMQNGQMGGMGLGLNLPPAVAGDVPDDVVAAMTAGLLDEYHAYAVYQAVIDQFGAVRPFVNIQRAESQHIAAWEFIFNRYGIDLPEAPILDPVPAFASLADACQVGADAEVANFDVYDAMLVTLADYPDMLQIATALRNASEFAHLPAFERCSGQ